MPEEKYEYILRETDTNELIKVFEDYFEAAKFGLAYFFKHNKKTHITTVTYNENISSTKLN